MLDFLHTLFQYLIGIWLVFCFVFIAAYYLTNARLWIGHALGMNPPPRDHSRDYAERAQASSEAVASTMNTKDGNGRTSKNGVTL